MGNIRVPGKNYCDRIAVLMLLWHIKKVNYEIVGAITSQEPEHQRKDLNWQILRGRENCCTAMDMPMGPSTTTIRSLFTHRMVRNL